MKKSESSVSRRQFLKWGAMAAAAGLFPLHLLAAEERTERYLSFYNTHTSESLKTVYWADGRYIPESLSDINRILRDHRTGDAAEMHPRLLDLLHRLQGKLETNQPFHIISGYRSPATNATLAAHSDGVARHSLHMEAKAADIRVPGRELAMVRGAAASLQGGGVGYYPASDFVHVDVGRLRHWHG